MLGGIFVWPGTESRYRRALPPFHYRMCQSAVRAQALAEQQGVSKAALLAGPT